MADILKRLAILLAKLLVMLFCTGMVILPIPELLYDFGAEAPAEINSPDDIGQVIGGRSTFVKVKGKVDFSKVLSHSTYGLPYSYFLLEEPYGTKLLIRSYEKITPEWTKIDTHVGRLKRRMPFSRTIRTKFKNEFDIDIPASAYVLLRDDVPKPNGWQVAALIFSLLLWTVAAYLLFVRPGRVRRRKAGAAAAISHSPDKSTDR